MADFSFNLVVEPWISCTDLNGNPLTLSLSELFSRAHELQAIQDQNPLTEAALLRVLLAVVHRAVDGPRRSSDWKALYKAGKFDDRVAQYLQDWKHHFDLFSPQFPFYQTAGLEVVDKDEAPTPLPIVNIIMGRSCGNNKTLFDHTTSESAVRVSPASAANLLITAQMFSLQGLNKKTTNMFGYQQSFLNSVLVNGIFIALTGKSLFETLTLNLLIYSDNHPIPNTADDCPVWERPDQGGANRCTPKGYLDYLTCKCRHIQLIPEQENGQVFVEHIHLAQGEAFPEVSNPGFLKKRKKDQTWYHPQLDPDRMVWRDSTSLFSFSEQSDERPMAFRQVQSMRGTVPLSERYVCVAYALANRQANPLAWRKERLCIPVELLTESDIVAYLERGMSLAEKGAFSLRNAVNKFLREYLPDKSKDVAKLTKASGAVRSYWDRLEGHFQQFLLMLIDPDDAIATWEKAIRQLTHHVLDECVRNRYSSSARTYRAWTAATVELNMRLAKLHN